MSNKKSTGRDFMAAPGSDGTQGFRADQNGSGMTRSVLQAKKSRRRMPRIRNLIDSFRHGHIAAGWWTASGDIGADQPLWSGDVGGRGIVEGHEHLKQAGNIR